MTYSKLRELLQELRDHLGLVHDPKGKTLTLLDEALALLDAPEGEGREGPQWISVEERLPEVRFDTGNFKGFTHKVLTVDVRGRCDVGFVDTETGLWRVAWEYRNVTYWMPLPAEPPAPQASRSTDTNEHE